MHACKSCPKIIVHSTSIFDYYQNMSQEQPKRPQEEEAIKYGDIARQAITPGDAAVMQAAENRTFGHIQKGGPAAVMQSIAGQVVAEDGQRARQRASTAPPSTTRSGKDASDATIGEALEATSLTDGSRPVDYSDAAAIQAAEVRATGRINIVPGGVAAAAQSAATHNARVTSDDEKTKLGDILGEASAKLPSDRAVTRRDAEGVMGAELRNDPNLCTHPGGVGATLAAAARLNQSNMHGDDQNQDK